MAVTSNIFGGGFLKEYFHRSTEGAFLSFLILTDYLSLSTLYLVRLHSYTVLQYILRL